MYMGELVKGPRQGMISLGAESSEASDKVKAEIQEKRLLPIDLQIQLTMSRQRSKTGDYRPLNLQMQLTMSRQRSKTRNCHLLSLQMQLTMSKQRFKTRHFHLLNLQKQL